MVQVLLGGAVRVFFRNVHCVGLENVPPHGTPVIFAGNHPNSLIDPVLIVTTCGRIVHFAAKDKLFQWPLAPFLRALGCVPIARKVDHGDRKRSNDHALAALTHVLGEGRCMGIFPEGLSHDQSSIQRLRTGCARIALQAARDGLENAMDVSRSLRRSNHHAMDLDIALHHGRVMYGNIGSENRLDFTVIGPAVNEAARMEGMCSTLDVHLLMSDAFTALLSDRSRISDLGAHGLRGVTGERRLYTGR